MRASTVRTFPFGRMFQFSSLLLSALPGGFKAVNDSVASLKAMMFPDVICDTIIVPF